MTRILIGMIFAVCALAQMPGPGGPMGPMGPHMMGMGGPMGPHMMGPMGDMRPPDELKDFLGLDDKQVATLQQLAKKSHVAMRTGDKSLLDACRTLFDSVANKRMYLTGGCGSTRIGEAFTVDYDLPNETAYAESCAAMALVQFARRMADATGEPYYADVMEQALYNNALSGISMDGSKFFYANPLTIDDTLFIAGHISPVRQPWFNCSCCPTSYCRFLPQLAGLGWSKREGELRCNIPAAGTVKSDGIEIEISGRYPYEGNVGFRIVSGGNFTLSVRIPSWCGNWSASLNGKKLEAKAEDGYLVLSRDWAAGDRLELRLELTIDVVRANAKVTADAGKIALMRGPVVYALESVDNGPGVNNLQIPADQEFRLGEAAGLPGVPAVCGDALRESDESAGALYFRNRTPKREKVAFTAVPYALWQNRGKAELATWLRSN